MAAICVLGTLLSALLSKVTASAQLKFTINMPMTILPYDDTVCDSAYRNNGVM